MLANGAQRVVDDLRLARTEEDDVAAPGAGAIQHGGHCLVGKELEDRRLQLARSAVDHLDPGQAPGAMASGQIRVAVDGAAAQVRTAGQAQNSHATPGIGGRSRKDPEFDPAHQVGHLGHHQRVAQIRRIGAVALSRLPPGQPRQRIGQFHVQHRPERMPHEILHHRHDRLLVHEGGLDVHLGELGLAVGAQVLVPEALDDLVIAVEARHHQQLFQQLRRLRQRERNGPNASGSGTR